MNRPSLADLGVYLPPLAVTSNGALPATTALREARRAHARAVLSDAELAEETHRACEYWIAVQERIGMDVLVDGELDGRDLVCRFTDRLDGFTSGGLVRIYGDRYRRKPVIAAPVAWHEPISVDGWRSLQALASRPLKARVTGPYTLMRWSFDVHYPTRDAACAAIAVAIRQELNALVTAGARVIQIDEPALAESGADWSLAAEALRVATTGLGAYVVAYTGHCPGVTAAGPHPTLPVDNLDLSVAEPEILPEGIQATIDVFGGGTSDVPTATAIRSRLEAVVAAYGGPERLWVSSSSALAYTTPDRAEEHLEAVVRAAAAARGARTPASDAAPLTDDSSPVTAPTSDETAATPPSEVDPALTVEPSDEAPASASPADREPAGD